MIWFSPHVMVVLLPLHGNGLVAPGNGSLVAPGNGLVAPGNGLVAPDNGSLVVLGNGLVAPGNGLVAPQGNGKLQGQRQREQQVLK